jgi:hypothetical protein
MPKQNARLAVALLVLALVGRVAAEPSETPAPSGPIPITTLDALPLGIPFSSLSEAARAQAAVVLGASLFAHRVNGVRYRSREAVFRFLVDHPDFATDVARALRIAQYRVIRTEDGFAGDDRRGAQGVIRVLHADDDRRLFHVQGRYDRRGLPTIEGQLLVLLEFRHALDADGVSVVDSSLTGHVRLDSPLAGALGHVVEAVARPLVERAVERKVRQFFGRVARVSTWAHDRPGELLAALEGHPEITPGPTFDAFRALLLEGQAPAWVSEPFALGVSSLDAPGE